MAALEGAWDVVRAHHPEVPPVVLVFGSCTARRAARRKLGHFAPARWLPVHDGEPFEPQALPEAIDDGDLMAQLAASAERLLRSAELLSWEAAASLSEVLITADGLAGSASEVMGTLVHEAAHAIAFQRGIKDTSRQGRYHNQRFKAIAEEIGLDVRRDPGWGWSVTTLSDPTAASYRDTQRARRCAARRRSARAALGFTCSQTKARRHRSGVRVWSAEAGRPHGVCRPRRHLRRMWRCHGAPGLTARSLQAFSPLQPVAVAAEVQRPDLPLGLVQQITFRYKHLVSVEADRLPF